jgi:hypothetical protein
MIDTFLPLVLERFEEYQLGFFIFEASDIIYSSVGCFIGSRLCTIYDAPNSMASES